MTHDIRYKLRICVSCVLFLGCVGMFNESETFIPNLVGLACAALLTVINRKAMPCDTN